MLDEPRSNQARPLYRMLAAPVALVGWFAGVSMLIHIVDYGTSDYFTWTLTAGTLLGALSFSYVVVAGYMPRNLLRLFGATPPPEDLK